MATGKVKSIVDNFKIRKVGDFMDLNLDVKKAIRTADLKFWEVAKELELADSTFSRKLRFELTEEFKNSIFKAIEKLSGDDKKNETSL